ncbi:MAG: hypothetical protein GXY38_08560 [Planctomycetes bacterium]|nr:hypothetical protein [Planctomycetota bacterium]
MTIELMRDFFMWCTIINGALLILSALVLWLGGNWAFGVHGRMYGLSRESFNESVYRLLGVYKILWIILNVVPLVALAIIA